MYIQQSIKNSLNLVVIFFLSHHMQEPTQDSIPRSIINGGNSVRADLNHSKGKGELLFISPKFAIVGLQHFPYVLITTPLFSEADLSSDLKKSVYEVKELVLQPTFIEDLKRKPEYCMMPKWLFNFKRLEQIRFRYVKLDDLEYLADLPIRHIILDNVKYSDEKKIVRDLKMFKNLKEISYDQSLSKEIINAIKRMQIKCSIINDAD